MKNRNYEDKITELEKGYCYLIKEEKPSLSWKLFEALTAHSQGLCITRIYPQKLRERKELKNSNVLWLSHTPGNNRCSPSALSTLAKFVFKAVEKKCPVLLDGLEYLVVQNGFNQTLMFVEQMNEFVMERGSIVLIPINPKAFDQRELALLERNLKVWVYQREQKKSGLSRLMEKY